MLGWSNRGQSYRVASAQNSFQYVLCPHYAGKFTFQTRHVHRMHSLRIKPLGIERRTAVVDQCQNAIITHDVQVGCHTRRRGHTVGGGDAADEELLDPFLAEAGLQLRVSESGVYGFV